MRFDLSKKDTVESRKSRTLEFSELRMSRNKNRFPPTIVTLDFSNNPTF